jgi:hypothetical protein
MQFSPFSCHLIYLRSKYHLQCPAFKYSRSIYLPYCQRPSFTPIRNHRQNYSRLYNYFNLIFLQRVIVLVYCTIYVTNSNTGNYMGNEQAGKSCKPWNTKTGNLFVIHKTELRREELNDAFTCAYGFVYYVTRPSSQPLHNLLISGSQKYS